MPPCVPVFRCTPVPLCSPSLPVSAPSRCRAVVVPSTPPASRVCRVPGACRLCLSFPPPVSWCVVRSCPPGVPFVPTPYPPPQPRVPVRPFPSPLCPGVSLLLPAHPPGVLSPGRRGSMAGRRAAIKAIDWAAFSERVPPNQKAMFNALKTRSDALSAR